MARGQQRIWYAHQPSRDIFLQAICESQESSLKTYNIDISKYLQCKLVPIMSVHRQKEQVTLLFQSYSSKHIVLTLNNHILKRSLYFCLEIEKSKKGYLRGLKASFKGT
jgi:hypothetical protein